MWLWYIQIMTTDIEIKPSQVRHKAMDLLARREHSRLELLRKLRQREYPDALIIPELDKLEAENLLSDQRFAESYINMRRKAGFGPVRIREELRERGVSNALFDTYLDESDTIWVQQAAQVRAKKFGEACAVDFEQRVKQAKFLNYRGFNQQQIDTVAGLD